MRKGVKGRGMGAEKSENKENFGKHKTQVKNTKFYKNAHSSKKALVDVLWKEEEQE